MEGQSIHKLEVQEIVEEVEALADIFLRVGRKFLGSENVADLVYPKKNTMEHVLFASLYLNRIREKKYLTDSNNIIVDVQL